MTAPAPPHIGVAWLLFDGASRHGNRRVENVMLTRDQVLSLRTDAAEAGDLAQVFLCDLALDGDEEAMAACEEAIAEAKAADVGTVDS